MEAFNFATSLDLTELTVHVRMYELRSGSEGHTEA
jgi:hypothetical protein